MEFELPEGWFEVHLGECLCVFWYCLLGIGRFERLMALLIFLESKFILSEPSGFGGTTTFDIHGAGSDNGCSSITSFFILSYMTLSIDQSINQSINQPINQSINQSISQSINQSISQSINQSIKQARNEWMNEWMNESVNQSINQFIHDERNIYKQL